jgi:hypothetical protein
MVERQSFEWVEMVQGLRKLGEFLNRVKVNVSRLILIKYLLLVSLQPLVLLRS